MIYTACKYAPEELFAGFGEEVCRLDPNPASFTCADSCAHPNLCGFAKAVIEEARARGARRLLLTDCCDAMRRTYDVLARQGAEFCRLLPLPRKAGAREIRLFAGELRALRDEYAAFSGRAFSPEAAVEACRRRAAEPEPDGPFVTLAGAHGGSLLLERAAEALPGLRVRDGTCTGARRFAAERLAETPETEEGFFAWYAALLLGMPPCMRMADAGERLSRLAADPGRGIIYHTVKFCDYYGFEYEALRGRTAVPLLKIETDTTPGSSGQLATRLAAFAETLGVTDMKDGQARLVRVAAGIDSGSTSTDAAILDRRGRILGSAVVKTGMSASASAAEALETALRRAGLERRDVDALVTTGYGRDFLSMGGRSVTEITCHARGARRLFPGASTVIDIGGQDSKVIRIDAEGRVQGFVMNDKCAAGTGRFLEMQARALGLSPREMSGLGERWRTEVEISSMCTVFAESEVVSLVARNTAPEDIIHGLNRSVARKTASLVRRGGGRPGYAMTGGVSLNRGVVRCLEEELGERIEVSEHSQLCGAIGAALLALDAGEAEA